MFNHIDGSLHYWRPLALSAAGAWTTQLAALPEGACNAIRVSVDDHVVYGQPEGRPFLIKNHNFGGGGVQWTAGAGWTITAGTGATHSGPGGGTNDLYQDTSVVNPDDPLIVGETYLVVFSYTGRTAGDITPKIGTGAGTARSAASGTYAECITAATNGRLIFTPHTDFDGTITYAQVFGRTPSLKKGVWDPLCMSWVLGVATEAAPATLIASGAATVRVTAGWYKRPLGA